jgi:hypothetical protein
MFLPSFRRLNRRLDVTHDADDALKTAQEFAFLIFDRHQFRNRPSALGDDHRFAGCLDIVHERKAAGLELSCGNTLHHTGGPRSQVTATTNT